MSGGKIALLIFGIVFLVGGLVLMAGGGGLVLLSMTAESDDAVFASRDISLKSADAYAIVTDPFEIDWYDESQSGGWLNEVTSAEVEAENRDTSKGVFIGIARETDVNDYLAGVQYCELVQWSTHTFDDPEVEYRTHSGSNMPSPPANETLWVASAHGTGLQTLEWKPEMGRWVLVFMNEDGSAGIDVRGTLGVGLPWLFWLGVCLFPVGVVLVVGGTVMVFFAARGPKRPVVRAPSPGAAMA